MYRVILIDDEPLILAGIASLICWEEYDCSIVGKATNGHKIGRASCRERVFITV